MSESDPMPEQLRQVVEKIGDVDRQRDSLIAERDRLINALAGQKLSNGRRRYSNRTIATWANMAHPSISKIVGRPSGATTTGGEPES